MSKIKELDNYIELIEDSKLKELCRKVIGVSHDQLKQPSSSSGMYHPKDELSEYGQVIHIMKAVNLSLHALNRFNFIPYFLIDLVITNAILHDLPYKFDLTLEVPEGKSRMDRNHGYTNATYIKRIAQELYIGRLKTDLIFNSVCFHMGKWHVDNHNKELRSHNAKVLLEVLQEADYFSSRKNISVDYNLTITKELVDNARNIYKNAK